MPLFSILTRFGWALLVLLGLGLGYLAVTVIAVLLINDPIVATLIVNAVIVIIYLLVSRLRPRWLSFTPRALTDKPGHLMTWIGGAFVVVFIAGQTVAIMAYGLVGSKAFDESVEQRSNSSIWAVLALTLALAPVAEELLLRGIAYPLLRKHVGITVSTILTAGIFALMHGNLVQAIAVIPVGVLLAMLYERSRSPWPGVVVHMVYNIAAIIVPPTVVSAVATPLIAVSLTMFAIITLLFLHRHLHSVSPRWVVEASWADAPD